jgi:hypothetical protein
MIEQFEEHGGGVTDEALIDLVGTAFDEGRRGHDASDVLARGRQLRRRKRAVPAFGALGVLAASASLALALTGTNTAASASPGHILTSNGGVVNVDNASFSVHMDAKTGIVTITFRQIFDADKLEPILAKAGIRATFNARCDKTLAITDRNVVDAVIGTRVIQGSAVITIDPSKMPSGSVLDFSFEPSPYLPYTGVGVGLFSREPTGACAPS